MEFECVVVCIMNEGIEGGGVMWIYRVAGEREGR